MVVSLLLDRCWEVLEFISSLFFQIPTLVCHILEACMSRFFGGIEENMRRIHWVKWDLLLNSKEKGGPDVGSLDAFKLALLYKWRWRFLNEQQSLWVRCLKCLHGQSAGLMEDSHILKGGVVWEKIVASIKALHDQDCVGDFSLTM